MADDEFLRRMRAARAYAGISQTRMARHLNRSMRWFTSVESGERPISDNERQHLARALSDMCDVPYNFFFANWQSLDISDERRVAVALMRLADRVQRAGDQARDGQPDRRSDARPVSDERRIAGMLRQLASRIAERDEQLKQTA